MNTAIVPVALILTLVTAALTGPRLIRVANPVLVRRPRTSVALLATTVVVWLIAFMSMGPLLAWLMTGSAGDATFGACRRCLESSNPWAGPFVDLGVPAFLILGGPALLVVAAASSVAWRVAASGRDTRQAAARIQARARVETVRGHRVLVLPDRRPEAFALPARHGGIVLSEGSLSVLADDELDAVLAHEQAHIGQRHHLIAVVSRHVEALLRPIPLIRAAAAAVPLCLEVAADNAARDRSGTRPLVSALLRLSVEDSGAESMSAAAPGTALHAVGPQRIRTLVGDGPQTVGATTMVATSAQSVVLAVLSAVVLLPWLVAMTSGCA